MIWCIADKMKFVSFYCTQLIVVFADFWLKYRVNSLFLHSVATFWTIGRQIIHNYTNTIFEYYSDANWFWILAFEAFWIYRFIQWIWTWKKSISNLRINIDIQRWVTFISQNKLWLSKCVREIQNHYHSICSLPIWTKWVHLTPWRGTWTSRRVPNTLCACKYVHRRNQHSRKTADRKIYTVYVVTRAHTHHVHPHVYRICIDCLRPKVMLKKNTNVNAMNIINKFVAHLNRIYTSTHNYTCTMCVTANKKMSNKFCHIIA